MRQDWPLPNQLNEAVGVSLQNLTFDNIDHQEFVRYCVDLGLPVLLFLAMFRELASGVCSVNVQGFGRGRCLDVRRM